MTGWKTITFNVVSALLAIADQLLGTSIISPELHVWINVAGNIVLRLLTTGPAGLVDLFKK